MNDNAPTRRARLATITLTFEPPDTHLAPAFVACVRADGRPVLTLDGRSRAAVERLAHALCAPLGLRVVETRIGEQSLTPVWLDDVADDEQRERYERRLERLEAERVRLARAA